MQSVLVVVAQASQPSVMPQSIAQSEDYFSFFELPRRFGQDLDSLEASFYRLSRVYHPDRFTASSLEAKAVSLQKMSFLNQAYSTLKSSLLLRDYLLRLEGVDMNAVKSTLPVKMAETWFELQELAMESEGSLEVLGEKLSDFQVELVELQKATEENLKFLETQYDSQQDRSILERLAGEVQVSNYLQSLAKAVPQLLKKWRY